MSRSARRIQGVSILELLVALGIVIAVSALLVPWTFGWLGGRELDSAEDRLAMHMMMARAAAREEGKPVEVVAGAGGVEARWLAEDAGSDAENVLDAPLFRESSDAALGFGASIDADWAAFRLPAGVQIDVASGSLASGADAGVAGSRGSRSKGSDSPGAGRDGAGSARAFDERGTDDGADEAAGAQAGDGSGGSQTLAIFLPDGTVIMAPVFLLRTDAGAVRRMRVDGATGRPKQVAGGSEADDAFVRPDFDPAPPAQGR